MVKVIERAFYILFVFGAYTGRIPVVLLLECLNRGLTF